MRDMTQFSIHDHERFSLHLRALTRSLSLCAPTFRFCASLVSKSNQNAPN